MASGIWTDTEYVVWTDTEYVIWTDWYFPSLIVLFAAHGPKHKFAAKGAKYQFGTYEIG